VNFSSIRRLDRTFKKGFKMKMYDTYKNYREKIIFSQFVFTVRIMTFGNRDAVLFALFHSQ
jgi:hypothetical protein